MIALASTLHQRGGSSELATFCGDFPKSFVKYIQHTRERIAFLTWTMMSIQSSYIKNKTVIIRTQFSFTKLKVSETAHVIILDIRENNILL